MTELVSGKGTLVCPQCGGPKKSKAGTLCRSCGHSGNPTGKKGGRQPGAGRKKGFKELTKKRLSIRDRVLTDGKITPLELLVKHMRRHEDKADRLETQLAKMDPASEDTKALKKEVSDHRQAAQRAAGDAAPFIHPKLQSVTMQGEDGPLKVEIVRFGNNKTPE